MQTPTLTTPIDSTKIKTSYVYQQLQTSTLLGALDCIEQTFRNSEPLTAYLKVCQEEFKPFVQELLHHSLAGGLSWVALDPYADKVIGARLVVDFKNDYSPSQSFGTKMDTILRFLFQVSLPLKKLPDLAKEKMVHSHMVAIDGQYQRRGVAQELLSQSSIRAYDLGYRTSVGEITNQYNRNLLSQFPSFQELNRICYADYEINGQKIFANLLEHESCVLYQVKLQDFIKRS